MNMFKILRFKNQRNSMVTGPTVCGSPPCKTPRPLPPCLMYRSTRFIHLVITCQTCKVWTVYHPKRFPVLRQGPNPTFTISKSLPQPHRLWWAPVNIFSEVNKLFVRMLPYCKFSFLVWRRICNIRCDLTNISNRTYSLVDAGDFVFIRKHFVLG